MEGRFLTKDDDESSKKMVKLNNSLATGRYHLMRFPTFRSLRKVLSMLLPSTFWLNGLNICLFNGNTAF